MSSKAIATKGQRFAAYFIDQIIAFMIPSGIITAYVTSLKLPQDQLLKVSIITQAGIFLFAFIVYYPGLTMLMEATIGKKLLGIKVASADGEELSLIQIFLRECVFRLLGTIIFGSIWLFFNDRNRTSWDIMAKSIVVKADE